MYDVMLDGILHDHFTYDILIAGHIQSYIQPYECKYTHQATYLHYTYMHHIPCILHTYIQYLHHTYVRTYTHTYIQHTHVHCYLRYIHTVNSRILTQPPNKSPPSNNSLACRIINTNKSSPQIKAHGLLFPLS